MVGTVSLMTYEEWSLMYVSRRNVWQHACYDLWGQIAIAALLNCLSIYARMQPFNAALERGEVCL